MRLLALDLSTHTGWAFFDNGKLNKIGLLEVEKLAINYTDEFTLDMIQKIFLYLNRFIESLLKLILDIGGIQQVVIERTNLGRQRTSQTILEWIHLRVLESLLKANIPYVYLDSSQWRKIVGLKMSKDDKKNNREVKTGKKRGKITKKHLAVRLANEIYGLELKIKDNDIADAILLGHAYLNKV